MLGDLNLNRCKPSLITFLLLLVTNYSLAAEENVLYQNLKPIEGAKAALAEIDPNADFGVYKRVMLLETYVAFRSGWARDQQRTGSRIRISEADMDRIKTGVAEQFADVFSEVLSEDDGYEIVTEAGSDVLLIRPAIIDLEVNAPDTMNAGRSRTFTTETGAATLYIELYDSVSGQILGRAADRELVQRPGNNLTWSNRASNTADARRLFRSWATALREFLDTHYSE
mgnify:CR=1 FL=1